MDYSISLTIPSSTTSSSPSSTTVKVSAYVLNVYEIEFPAGCAGLVGVSVWQGGHQLYPSTEGQWFISDNFTIKRDTYYKIVRGGNTLTIKGYNSDDTYSHTIQFRCSIEKDWVVSLHNDLNRMNRLLKAFLGKFGIA